MAQNSDKRGFFNTPKEALEAITKHELQTTTKFTSYVMSNVFEKHGK